MKCSPILLSAVALFLVSDLSAATHADSILAFTGATRAKLAWPRNRWCADDYTPLSSTSFFNGKYLLTGYDTYDNRVRVFNDGVGSTNYDWMAVHVDRSGKWVVWSDKANRCCWVRDFDAALPARQLIPTGKTIYGATNFGYEKATNTEYLYVLDNFDTTSGPNEYCYCSLNSKAYKIHFNWTDGTVDLAKKVDLGFQPNGSQNNLGISSVSADGKYVACNFPWPSTYLFDTQSKTLVGMHDQNFVFGCQPHVSPDNVYRFYHCMDDHQGIALWLTPQWSNTPDVELYMYQPQNHLCGRDPNDTLWTDFAEPQWSNHPRFLSNTYPVSQCYGTGTGWGRWGDLGTTQAWVKTQMQMQYKPSVILQRFAPDFKSVEASMYICPDLRSLDCTLDS